MLHPVGPLPAAVYWRRRLLVLLVLLVVLGGGGWLGVSLLTGSGDTAAAAGSAASSSPVGTPALDRVVPSLAGVQTPTPPPSTTPPAPQPPAPPAQEAGAPCGDDVVALEVRTPGSAPSGSAPVLELVVTNTAAVPCTRVLDKQLQEMVLLDAAGARLWGSNDCQPETSSDTRTLAPGEQVVFPLTWSGLTSEPTCTAARVPVAPGSYVVRARLDTKTSPDAPLQIT
ncbi:hypothetical protein SAMN04488107_3554 [Geodermatophilus saharensis]|uniref:MucR family transcriptional regulator n=1 Tax=Geodermatophilus saharensis TaxID=1137994 RepID=A0A239GT52_9ACTN|nr:MucR family transcriptional regulator [Geodermatophilus saharensis]SNS72065.1 hypothetical protein SAMN04488107_3554 [Geodermatophilus saharensis]